MHIDAYNTGCHLLTKKPKRQKPKSHDRVSVFSPAHKSFANRDTGGMYVLCARTMYQMVAMMPTPP